MRRVLAVLLVVGSIAAVAPVARGSLLSKTYNFKSDVTLEIGAATEEGLRIDSVRFLLPSTLGGRLFRTGGLVNVEVALSNTASTGQRVGIAVALFDEQGRLVGVASGGSRWVPIKPDRQKLFRLVFDDVNGEAYRAKTFQISVESKF